MLFRKVARVSKAEICATPALTGISGPVRTWMPFGFPFEGEPRSLKTMSSVLGSRRADRNQRCGQSCQSQELLARDAGRNVVLPNRSSSGPKGRGDFLQKYSRAETSDHARDADLAAVGVEEHDLSPLVPISVFVALFTLAASS